MPEHVPPFCGTCGAPVITACENCGAGIPNPNYLARQTEPNPFCVGCGEPFPWVTREQLIGKLYGLIDFEGDLSPADRLQVIEAIAVLSEQEEPETVSVHARAAAKIRELVPGMWQAAQPYLRVALSEEVQDMVHHMPH